MASPPPGSGAGTLRLFVACELPAEVKEALGRVEADLRRLGGDRLRWVRPEGIHVTLKFLGEVEEGRTEEITRALSAAVPPFALRLRPAALGVFPSASRRAGGGPARLRVVWVGLEGDVEELAALAARVDEAMAGAGFPRERRPFAGHLTLARAPDHLSTEERRRLAALIQRYQPPPFPSMLLSRVSLMQSTLGPGGSVYHRLGSFPAGVGETPSPQASGEEQTA